MTKSPPPPWANLVESLLDEQDSKWLEGASPAVEVFLGRHPSLNDVPAAQLDLISNEIGLREHRGEHPTLEEYTARFPHLGTELRDFFDVNDAVISGQIDTRPLDPPTPRSPKGDHEPVRPGEVVGKCEILSKLGSGGVGVVYKAHQANLDRTVAVKFLQRAEFDDVSRSRFALEAEALAKLQHPNIVQVFDFGDHKGSPYLVMEYVEGSDLSRRLADDPLSAKEATSLVRTLATAMEQAHRRGIVHRDLKPANVLLTPDGQPKITDFGLARRVEIDDPEPDQAQRVGVNPHDNESEGAYIGTPSYMAPEQAAGKASETSPATDVYALGAVLYECLTGRPPFQAANTRQTFRQILTVEPIPPGQLNPAVSRDLQTICLKCLEKEPARRYSTTDALAEDLRRFQQGEPIQARPVGLVERGLKWAKRRPTAALLIVAVAAAVLLLVTAGVYYAQEKRVRGQRNEAQRQRDEAQRLRRLAQLNEEEAEKQKRRAEQANELAEVRLYARRISQAAREGDAGNVKLARQLLLSTKPELRGWEYRHLYHKLHQLGQRTFYGHEKGMLNSGAVLDVDFSPDGVLLASAGEDTTLRIWDTRTGRQVRILPDHGWYVDCVRFGPKGRWLLCSCWGAVIVRNAISWEVVEILKVGSRIWDLEVSPDGRYLTATDRTEVGVWEMGSWKELHRFQFDEDSVVDTEFTANSELLAIGTKDGLVRFRRCSTGEEDRVIRTKPGSYWSLAFSPNGKHMLTGGDDGRVFLREIRSGEVLHTFEAYPEGIGRIAFGPDGHHFATVAGKVLRIGSTLTGRYSHTFSHSHDLFRIRFDPRGHRVACGTWDGRVKLWDVVSGQAQHESEPEPVDVSCSAVSPDGRWLATGREDGVVVLRDLRTSRTRRELLGHTAEVSRLCFSPDSTLLASTQSGGDTVRLWSIPTGRKLRSLEGLPDIRAMTFSGNGSRLLTIDSKAIVREWDPDKGLEIRTTRMGEGLLPVARFSPDGKRVACAYPIESDFVSDAATTLVVWELSTGRKILRGKTGGTTRFLEFSPEGRWLASSDFVHDSGVFGGKWKTEVWDTRSGENVHTLHVHHYTNDTLPWPGMLEFDPDGRRLFISAGHLGTWIVDIETGEPILHLPFETEMSLASFDPAGRLFDYDKENRLWTWETVAEPEARLLSGHTESIERLGFSPDDRLLFSATLDEAILWDVRTAKLLHRFVGFRFLGHHCFSQDSRFVALAADKEISLWDTKTGKLLRILEGHTKEIDRVEFSPDAKRLASRSSDKTVRVWDVSTGKILRTLEGHQATDGWLRFSPNGKSLASVGGKAPELLVWSLESGRLLQRILLPNLFIFELSFSPDSRSVAILSDEVRRTWEISSGKMSETPVDLSLLFLPKSPLLATIVDGKKIRLTPTEPKVHPLKSETATNAVWHERHAEAAEKAGDWFAAIHHLSRALRSRPLDPSLHHRLGYAWLRQGRTYRATPHYIAAATLAGRRGLAPIDPHAAERAETAAAREDWATAVADFRSAVRQPNAPLSQWRSLLLAALASGDSVRSRHIVSEMRRRFLDSDDVGTYRYVLDSLLVCPRVEADARRFVEIAERLVRTKKDEQTLRLLAMSRYRAGRFAESLAPMLESIRLHENGGEGEAWLFLAMAYAKLGQHDRARTAYSQAITRLDSDAPSTWQAKLRRGFLVSEVERTMARSLHMPMTDE